MNASDNESYTLSSSEYCDVRARLAELGCKELNGFTFLPGCFEEAQHISELRKSLEALTIKKLLVSADLPYDEILPSELNLLIVQNNSVDMELPTLFITAGLLAENSAVVNVALGIIANYVTDVFKGSISAAKVKMKFVWESSDGRYRSMDYEGPAGELSKVMDAIEEHKFD